MTATVHSPTGMVVSADERASAAGVAVLRSGGTAVDAAIAANAVLAVTAPHLCGLGGDLFALVQDGDSAPVALNASGRAGSGADPDVLRAAGHTVMPLFDDVRSVTVPGCVDGWAALHSRFGRLPLAAVFAAAIEYAQDGFTASVPLATAASVLGDRVGAEELAGATAGAPVRRPGVARTLLAIAERGRTGFYCGEFGRGLIRLADGLFDAEDLNHDNADWVRPLSVDAMGHRVWVTPPNSQGYLVGLGLAIADGLPLPADPDDPLWAHLLIESARRAGCDRPELLHEGFDASRVLSSSEVERRRGLIDPRRAAPVPDPPTMAGDTTYLCAAERGGLSVSLIQSNAAGFGSRIFEPATGIGLHNRGLGFSLRPGHPAEYRPRRRPPHTLAPALVTRPDGSPRALVGTMGGDTQPQILLQVITRLLHNRQSPAEAVEAPRWRIGNSNGFDTWLAPASAAVDLEEAAPAAWDRLAAKGHDVTRVPGAVGHAHVIEMDADGGFAGAADPRTVIGAARGR